MDDQKIPRSWFRANNFALAISSIYLKDSGAERLAPLGEGERKLGWFVLPPFQRPPAWSPAQKARFIESIWLGLPLGCYIYNRTPGYRSPYDAWLLDGQQRITAILEYVDDQFQVMGYRWSELGKVDRRVFGMTPMACLETQLEDPHRLLEIYDRLAYGGTPHAPADMDFLHEALNAGDGVYRP